MDSSITIRWKKNPEGGTDVSVSGDIDAQTYFREVFLTLDSTPSLLDITERETSGESAGNSATMTLLNTLTDIICKSDKQSGHIVSEQERNTKFPYTDLITIRRFAMLAGIKIDETKFCNLAEFRRYYASILKYYSQQL